VAGGSVQQFFASYDRTKTSIAVTSHVRQYLNKTGEIINQEDSEQKMTSWDLLYNILRANFDGTVEGEYCQVPETEEGDGEGYYLYGHKVTAITDAGEEGVEVEFNDKDDKYGSLTVDLVFGADGPSSTVRKILLPEVERTYAGYVAWRGTVPEMEVTEETRKCFSEKFTFFHSQGVQILTYLIPGTNGTINPRNRLINYVWYCNYPANSLEHKNLMTDAEGTTHHFTLPVGKVQPSVWEKQKRFASSTLPPQFSELVQKTKQPFIQVITDVYSPQHVFFGGKLVLIGDALAGFRPHTAASTGQAALDALLLGKVFEGKMEWREWVERTRSYAREVSRSGIMMGDRSQFSSHPLADDS